MEIEDLATVAVDRGFKLHRRLGPGLPESVYEAVLAENLARRGVAVERQKPVPILFDGIAINEGFRADLLLEGRLLIELKSVERIAPVHGKQVLTYLRLLDLPLGLLMNFGAATFREGIKRIANRHGQALTARTLSTGSAVSIRTLPVCKRPVADDRADGISRLPDRRCRG